MKECSCVCGDVSKLWLENRVNQSRSTGWCILASVWSDRVLVGSIE